jgi:hypothetical protein
VRTSVSLAVIAVVLIAGVVFVPRSPGDVDPARVLAQALRVNQPSVPAIVGEIRKAQRERCTPVLEGSDRVAGRDAWAIRLKPPARKYPWIEAWVDKRTGQVLAWKEWGRGHGRVMVLRQFPRP